MRRILHCFVIMAAGLTVSAQAASQTLSGEYRSDCAPYDGAAFVVTLTAAEPSHQFWLRANAPLSAAVGRWNHGSLSAPGSSGIVYCRTVPETKCEYPQAGSFHIRAMSGGRMSGSFEARFAGNRLYRYRFTARPAAGSDRPVLCG